MGWGGVGGGGRGVGGYPSSYDSVLRMEPKNKKGKRVLLRNLVLKVLN